MSQTKNTLTPPSALIKRASYDMCVLEGAVSWNAGKGVNGGAVTGKGKEENLKKRKKKIKPREEETSKGKPGWQSTHMCVRACV